MECPKLPAPPRLSSDTNPVAHALLAGALLPGNSPLRLFQATPELLERIFHIHQHRLWKDALLVLPSRFKTVPVQTLYEFKHCMGPEADLTAAIKLFSFPSFPPAADRYCNMLPIRAHEPESLPAAFRPYLPLIARCEKEMNIQSGVLYLTVHESRVSDGGPQRRGGIHTDGFLARPEWYFTHDKSYWHRWGLAPDRAVATVHSGIVMASSVERSTRIWNARIPRRPSPVLSLGCDLDHLRDVLNEAAYVAEPGANEMYWMSDSTPHESLPLPPGTYRQFFRLVVGGVSAWWRQHSTVNPMVEPDAQIIEHSKFDDEAYHKVAAPEPIDEDES